MTDRYKVLKSLLGDKLEQYQNQLKELAESTLDKDGKTRFALTDTVYKQKEEIRQSILKEIKANLHEEISDNSILSKVELVLRDERQSGADANVPLTEAGRDYSTINGLAFYSIEDGGGRYGADAHMNNNYMLPIDANAEIYGYMPDIMSSILIRNSVMVGYRKYPQDAQELIAEGLEEPLRRKRVVGELRFFGATNAIADAGPAIRAVADNEYFRIRPEFSSTISKDDSAYSIEKAKDYLSWTVDAALASTLDFTRVQAYAAKDFAGRMPPSPEAEEKNFGTEFNATPADTFFKELNEVLPPHMVGVYHGHNTLGEVGYGIDTSISAFQNGAGVATFSISPSSTLAHPDLLEFLDRPEAKELGEINDFERALIETVGVIEESFHHVRNASSVVKDVSMDAKQGVGRTGAPGGGLANIIKNIENTTSGLDYSKKVLSTKYNGETVDISGMSDADIKKSAEERMTKIYFDILEDYRAKVGGPALVTPFYKYVNDLVQLNIKEVMDGNNQTLNNFDVIKDPNLLQLTDDARNMVTGRTDRMPIKPNSALTERAFDKFFEDTIKDIRQDIAYKNNIHPDKVKDIPIGDLNVMKQAASSIGKILNKGMDEAFDLVAAEEHLRDVRTINKKISQGRVNFGDMSEEMIQKVTDYYIDKEISLGTKRDELAKKYASTVGMEISEDENLYKAVRQAKTHYNLEKKILGKEGNAIELLEKLLDKNDRLEVLNILKVNSEKEFVNNKDFNKYLSQIITSRMEIKVNPLDVETYKKEDAQKAVDYARRNGMIKHVNDDQALHVYALGQVKIIDLYKWDDTKQKYDKNEAIEQPFNFFSPVSFINSRGKAIDILEKAKDNLLKQFPGDADVRKTIKGIFNSDFTAYATGIMVKNPILKKARPILEEKITETLVKDLERIGYDFGVLDRKVGMYGEVHKLASVKNPGMALKNMDSPEERETAEEALKVLKGVKKALGIDIYKDVLNKKQTMIG